MPWELQLTGLRGHRGREAIKPGAELKWWLVYGPPRTGSTYMVRLIKRCSTLYVSDWGLEAILEVIPAWLEARSSPVFDYIRFDQDRFVNDISANILDNAYPGGGSQLDLVYKQATLRPAQYQAMIRMWGAPERAICCIRDPAGYIASAIKKFEYDTVEKLQEVYVNSLESYEVIGGDVFDYRPDLTVADYVSFLRPLILDGKKIPPFKYGGREYRDSTTQQMRIAYQRVRERATS